MICARDRSEVVLEFGLTFNYLCYHGPVSAAPNIGHIGQWQKGKSDAKREANTAQPELGFMSVSVIVTGVRPAQWRPPR
jgi:hypothetical protein